MTLDAGFKPCGAGVVAGQGRPNLSFSPGLYVHVPFCSAICPYCDFAVQKDSKIGHSMWLEALRFEIEHWRDLAYRADGPVQGSDFDTVYLGGGTPSALEGEELCQVVEVLKEFLSVAEDAWWSIEVNPEDVTKRKVEEWRSLGFDFVSLGVQGLDANTLRRLGRRHSAQEALQSIVALLDGGFQVVSVDLIYGLPGQSAVEWRATLDQVAEIGPTHLSCYELTIHEGTPFGRALQQGRLEVMSEDKRGELFRQTHLHLERLGYDGYEVSNFARPGARSRHNQKYWHHVPYLGLGPSAHSFDGQHRWWNIRDLAPWSSSVSQPEKLEGPRSQGPGIEGFEHLTQEQLRLESLMSGLRCKEGVSLGDLEQRFGGEMSRLEPALAGLRESGLITDKQSWIEPTLEGRCLAEGLAVELSQILDP